ncbi:unnamed protein product [Spirodela intermedia]|uniref:Uncharacterized protein n=1 Tax=Spirodela intermedia TaxID=51605 RepID=A0A7I8JCL1_SPIIN|nr:unnamed protein product [Spirodela intermedia]CAA6667455.1 unnamed protein product [Spirodela intermedia]
MKMTSEDSPLPISARKTGGFPLAARYPDAQDLLAKRGVALGISRRNLLEIVRKERFTPVPTQETGPERPGDQTLNNLASFGLNDKVPFP